MSLPNLNARRSSFKKRNAISVRHELVFRSASIILHCPHPRQTWDEAKALQRPLPNGALQLIQSAIMEIPFANAMA